MDRLESMSILLTTAEAGSLSAASRRLGMPLATVSRRIADLENRLDAQLLTRTSRKIILTEPGKLYVAACKRILDEVADAERAAGGEYTIAKGDLTVTAPVVLGRLHLVPALCDLLQAYPDIDVRLTLTDRPVSLA